MALDIEVDDVSEEKYELMAVPPRRVFAVYLGLVGVEDSFDVGWGVCGDLPAGTKSEVAWVYRDEF